MRCFLIAIGFPFTELMLQTTQSIEETRAIRWADPILTWGLVPTMGALHKGHLSLVKRSIDENDRTAVSIFVNPKQFNDQGDLQKYPRTLKRDLELLDKAGVDLVFFPQPNDMYPSGFQSVVSVQKVSKPLEGGHRPGHFDGVTLVVAKLFNIIQPTKAYFGQKDAQQTVVLKRMVRDLNFNLELIVVPTVREGDGLAFSSRNVNLSEDERAAAPVLYRALQAGRALILEGEHSHQAVIHQIESMIKKEPLANIEYVAVTDIETLEPIDPLSGELLLSLAVYFGQTRLIDNIQVSV